MVLAILLSQNLRGIVVTAPFSTATFTSGVALMIL